MILAVIHQRNQPVRHIVDVRHNGPAGRYASDVFVVRNFVEIKRIAPFGKADTMFGLLHHIGRCCSWWISYPADLESDRARTVPRSSRTAVLSCSPRPRTSGCCRGKWYAWAPAAPDTSTGRTTPCA